MVTMMQRLILGLVVLGSTLACTETVDSTDVRTGGVYADYAAVANGAGTHVTARLKVGGDESNTYMDLEGEDRLVATIGNDDVRMTDDNNNEMYEASFAEDSGGTVVEIAFQRGPDDVDAPNSSATLPEGFTLSGVTENDTIQRTDDIVITWDPSGLGDAMAWDIDGDCVSLDAGVDRTPPDTGTLTIAAGQIEPKFESDAEETCDVTFTLDRSRAGSVDRHFNTDDSDGPGEFTATQRRGIVFRSAP